MSTASIRRGLPFLILFGGFALRLFRLGADSLWYDETVSLLLARSDLAEITRHTAGDIHPPLYYYLLHFWGGFAGWSEFSTAFFSLFFGVLLIALVYRIAREWLAPAAGEAARGAALIAAFLVAVSPYNVWYSQEVRMYTLGAALGLASVYFLLRTLRAPKILTRDFAAYVVVTVLGLYTLYYFLFLIAFEYLVVAVWLVLPRLRRLDSQTTDSHGLTEGKNAGGGRLSLLAAFAASQFALLLLYLPWLPIAFRQATDPPVPPWRSFTPLPDVLLQSFTALTLGQAVEAAAVAPVLVLILALLAYLFLARRATGAALLLLGYTFVPTLAIFLFSLWKPLYHVRYVFTYSPAFYILLALAIYIAARRLARVNPLLQPALAGGLLLTLTLASAYALNNYWFDPQYADDDLRDAVQRIAENWRPGDVILVDAGYAYPAILYYYDGPIGPRVRLSDYQPAPGDAQSAPLLLEAGSIGGDASLGWNDPRSDFYPTTAEATRAALDRVWSAHPRVWLLRLYDTVTDPGGVIRRYLADHGRLIDEQVYAGEANTRVEGYLTQTLTALPPGAHPSNARLADRVALLGFETGGGSARAGDFYDVVLYWQPLQSLNYNYQLSLQILDASGRLVAQHDETPLGAALPTSRWRTGEVYREPVRVQLPAALVPGAYGVVVKLYNLESGEVLGGPVPLGTLNVGP